MRSWGRSGVLSACIVMLALLGSACSSTVDGVDAPKTDEASDVAVAPLPTATSTASPTPAATPAPTSTPEPEAVVFERNIEQDFNRDGVVDSGDEAFADGPLVSGWPVIRRTADLAPVDLLADPERRVASAVAGSRFRPIDSQRTTPDGQGFWVSIIEDADDCVGRELEIAMVTDPEQRRPAEPVSDLPKNIVSIHHGPGNQVVLYTGCDGEVRPAAFAEVLDTGDFTNVRALDPLLDATTMAWPPSWSYGAVLGSTDYADTGSLIVSIPQVGLESTHRPAINLLNATGTVYIDVATGEVLDVYTSLTKWRATFGYADVESNGSVVTIAGQLYNGRETAALAVRGEAGPNAPAAAAIGGPTGFTVVTDNAFDYEFFEGERPVAAAAWAPTGPWVAFNGPAHGTWLYNVATEAIVELSDTVGEALYFTPDGSALVIAAPDLIEVLAFPVGEIPDDSDQPTAFSTLDSGGLGPIRVESLVSELREELDLNFRWDTLGEPEPGACAWVTVDDLPGVSMLGELVSDVDVVVTAIIVRGGPWATPSGLRLGSSEAEVRDAFGSQLDVSPHTYVPGNYMVFVPNDPQDNYSIKFETNGHQVTAMHAGRQNWIEFVEGCA